MLALPPLARPRGLRRPGHTRAARLVATGSATGAGSRHRISGVAADGSPRALGNRFGGGCLNERRPRLKFGAASAASGSGAATSGSAGASTAAVAQDSGSGRCRAQGPRRARELPRRLQPKHLSSARTHRLPQRRLAKAAPGLTARGLVALGRPGWLIGRGLRDLGVVGRGEPRLPGECGFRCFVGRGEPGLTRGSGLGLRLRNRLIRLGLGEHGGSESTGGGPSLGFQSLASSAGADQDCSRLSRGFVGRGGPGLLRRRGLLSRLGLRNRFGRLGLRECVAASTVAAAQRSEPRAS